MSVRRFLAIGPLLFALLMLVLTPRGFMPAAGGADFQLVICSAGGVSTPVAVDFGQDRKSKPDAASTDCPFALLLLGADASPPLLAQPLLLPLELVLLPLAPALVVRLAARLRPPAQAPPATL